MSDSFKSTMTSTEIGTLWKKRCGYDYMPVSDGGEGALEALAVLDDCNFESVANIPVLISKDTAYLETAKIVGYDRMQVVYDRSTQKIGDVIKKIVSMKIENIVIFIGGTSTNDGGFGLLSTLGYKFLDENGTNLNPTPSNLSKITSVKKCDLPMINMIACSDVQNPLCGPNGATFVYGTQKGITNHEEVDNQVKRIADMIDKNKQMLQGAGAGGGIGYGLSQFASFQIQDGYSYISNKLDYLSIIDSYEQVITGEGKLDSQTINGKLPYRILQDAKSKGLQVDGVFAVTEDSELTNQFDSVANVAPGNKVSEYNLSHTEQNYQNFITNYKSTAGMYKGILFDLDGVLCDTAGLHYLAWKKLANKLGGDIDEEFNETLKGVDRTESLNRILKHIDVKLSADKFEQAMKLKNDWYVQSLESLSEKDVLPGIESFIQELIAKDLKIAIASASKNAPVILERIGLMKFVNTIANPADVKQNKPAPDIFLLAAKQLGLSIYQCIGIEDSQAGIDALNSGGIDSISIGDVLVNATIEINKTSELTLDLLNK